MEILIFWIITIMVSFGMNFYTILQVFKDVADNGYIANKANIGNDTYENTEKNPNILFMLVPIVNIMQAMEFSVKYTNNKSNIIDMLRIECALEEMTDKELELYKKNPTGLNAFMLGFNRTLPEYNFQTNDFDDNSNNNDDFKSNSLSNREKIEELTKAKEELLDKDNNKNNVKTKSLKNNKK